MMLKDKVAVIYGAGGSVGGAVARAFAREGARLFLTGRHRAPVESVAKEAISAGGSAVTAEVDALDEQAVDRHLQFVIDKAGRIDVSFNAIGIPNTTLQGVPLVDLAVEQFALPITTYTRSYFLTRTPGRPANAGEAIGGHHDRHFNPVSDRHPVDGRRRSSDERRGGADSGSIRRARTSWHSRSWSATAGDAGVGHDQGSLRASRQGMGHFVGTVPGDDRRQDTHATAYDARGDG
jgi:Enoyl-(Acyl carrier protein) reductase